MEVFTRHSGADVGQVGVEGSEGEGGKPVILCAAFFRSGALTFLSSLPFITPLGCGGLPTVRWCWPPRWCGWCWICSFCSTSVNATSVMRRRREDCLGETVRERGHVWRPNSSIFQSTVSTCLWYRHAGQATGWTWRRGQASGDIQGEPGEDERNV